MGFFIPVCKQSLSSACYYKTYQKITNSLRPRESKYFKICDTNKKICIISEINVIYACLRMCFLSVILYLDYKLPGRLEKLKPYTRMFLIGVFIEGLLTLSNAFWVWPYDFYIYKTSAWGFMTCFIDMAIFYYGPKRNTDGYEQI